jgi:hypothetical protein
MKRCYNILLVLLIAVGLLFLTKQYIESFTSPGTLVQLSTSHVPDENDLWALQNYRRVVQRDLIDMTGGY